MSSPTIVRPDVFAQTGAIAQRSLRAMARQPQIWAPSIIFPLFFTALSSAVFERTRQLPGFPTVSSFVAYLLAATVIQGVLFGATAAGNDLALDIETGFFDRLVASPVARTAIITGRLAGSAVLGAFQALAFVVILMPFGATMAAGWPGAAVTVATGVMFASAVGGFSLVVAIRTGSVEAVQGFFPIFFAVVFLSSAFFPPNLSGGWFETVADVNPLSVMVDGLRHLHVVGWDSNAALKAVGVPTVMTILFGAASLRALQRRLAS